MKFFPNKTISWFFVAFFFITVLFGLETVGRLNNVRAVFLHIPQPIIRVFSSIISPVHSFFTTAFRLKALVKENAILESEMFRLEQETARLKSQERENETLRKELGFVQVSKLNLQPCSVLSENIFKISDTILLDCGSEQGVTEGQAVISQGYLAGKVVYVSQRTSTVILTTASAFLVDAKTSDSGTPAVVRGSFGSGMFVDQLPQDLQVQKGWMVVTAGINQKIPKDILIGKVNEITSTNNALFKKATLISPINFGMLRFVFVVK